MALVIYTSRSAIRTFVLPRGASDFLTRVFFVALRFLFDLRANKAHSYEERDHIMAIYAPLALLTLLPFWLILVLIGYMGMFRAGGAQSWGAAF